MQNYEDYKSDGVTHKKSKACKACDDHTQYTSALYMYFIISVS